MRGPATRHVARLSGGLRELCPGYAPEHTQSARPSPSQQLRSLNQESLHAAGSPVPLLAGLWASVSERLWCTRGQQTHFRGYSLP